MEDQFVSYKQALELRKLGFDEKCISYYKLSGTFSNDISNPKKYNSDFPSMSYISAPLYQQVFDWFRIKHKLFVRFENYYDERFYYKIDDMSFPRKYDFQKLKNIEEFKTFSKCRGVAVYSLIKIIKNV